MRDGDRTYKPIKKYFLLPFFALALLMVGTHSEASQISNILTITMGIILLIATVLYYYRMYVIEVKKLTVKIAYDNILIYITIGLGVITLFVG